MALNGKSLSMNIRTLVAQGIEPDRSHDLHMKDNSENWENYMTYSEYKESDLHKCVSIATDAMVSITKFAFKATTLLFRFFRWLAMKTYAYVMK